MKGASLPIPKAGYALIVIAVVAIVATIAIGPVQGALNQLGGEIEDKFGNRSPVAQVSEESQLAGLAKVTMDRAAECEAVESHKPYSDLSGTSLGSNPRCRVLPIDTLERFGENTNAASPVTGEGGGDDVEGRNGRIRINFTDDMVLSSEETYGASKPGDPINDWQNGPAKFSIVGVVNDGFYRAVDGSHANPRKPDHLTSRANAGPNQQPEYSYVVTFAGGNARNRYETKVDHKELQEIAQNAPGIYSNVGKAVLPVFAVLIPDREYGYSAVAYLDNNDNVEGSTKVKFCDGDKGYIQVNKLNPTDQSKEEDTEDSGLGRTPLFGYIQITEKAEDCSLFSPEDTVVVSYDVNTGGYPNRLDIDSTSDVDLVGEIVTEKHGAPGSSSFEDLPAPDSNECMVAVTEKDGDTLGRWDHGWLTFPEGNKITEDAFPDASQATDSSLPPGDTGFGNTGLLEGGGDNPEAAYKRLADSEDGGFNGAEVKEESVSFLEDDTFEPVGQVICGQGPGQSEAKWLVCDPNGQLDGQTVTADGTDYKCSGGAWSTT